MKTGLFRKFTHRGHAVLQRPRRNNFRVHYAFSPSLGIVRVTRLLVALLRSVAPWRIPGACRVRALAGCARRQSRGHNRQQGCGGHRRRNAIVPDSHVPPYGLGSFPFGALGGAAGGAPSVFLGGVATSLPLFLVLVASKAFRISTDVLSWPLGS